MPNTITRLRLAPRIECRHDPRIGEYVVRAEIVDDQGRCYGSVVCGRGHTIDREEQIARLWAAAGEMYEALQRYEQAERLEAELGGEQIVTNAYREARRLRDAALRKARGEAS